MNQTEEQKQERRSREKALYARAKQALENTSKAIDGPRDDKPVDKLVAVKTAIDVLVEEGAWSDVEAIVGLCHVRVLNCRNRLAQLVSKHPAK